ncbi:MAG TPA: thioredoxin family protein [Solimonas sp.]|nr:thioredoxin family protein [Solimonas sp.]
MTARLALLCLVFVTLSAPGPAIAAEADLPAALAQAQARRAAVVIDFHAPWCYSCYYMARNVLTGREWQAIEQSSVVMSVDADAPEGAALKDRLKVKALPSYVVLDASGAELGRILGEQTREDFYRQLGTILARGNNLDDLAAQVRDAGAASLAAGRSVLKSYHARYDSEGAFAWLASLPAAAATALKSDPEGQALIARLRFLQAAQAGDTASCLSAGAQVLAQDLACERSYELDRYLGCTAKAPARTSLLAAQRPAMDQLLQQRVFGKTPCADERSAVLAAADLYQALGDSAAEKALLQRAARAAEGRLGQRLSADRNQADNLRVYLDRAGDTARLDALMPRLVTAYPDDYVYAFRHGRSLLARGRAAEALPWLEKAAPLAYGINRLKVAQERVKALQALQREAEARKVVAEALKANGPWFPEEAAKLKGLLKA